METHCRDLAEADLILVFHPNWWGQPPAIVKGWIDAGPWDREVALYGASREELIRLAGM